MLLHVYIDAMFLASLVVDAYIQTIGNIQYVQGTVLLLLYYVLIDL